MAHKANGARVNNFVQDHEVLVLIHVLREMRAQIAVQFLMLLQQIGEVDEESRTHISLHHLNFLLASRAVVPRQQIAVLQESTAPNLFGISRRDQLIVQVIEGFLKVSEDTLSQ